jgi:hypothetical protein
VTTQVSIATVTPGGDCLRVNFHYQGDRFSHVVSLIGCGERPILLFESVEGTAADSWPPSPPLQSLHVEALPDGRNAALLVGMAGRGHWSASVEALAGGAALDFDIACRTQEPRAKLASTYRLAAAEGCTLFAAADRSWIEARQGESVVAITPSQDSAAAAKLAMLDATRFAIEPAKEEGGTIRWKYRVEVLPPDL